MQMKLKLSPPQQRQSARVPLAVQVEDTLIALMASALQTVQTAEM